MKLYSHLIFFFFLYSISFSQNYIIVDAETKKPLPFVAVHYDREGFYAGEHGHLKLPPDIQDSIKLQHLGYHTLKLSLVDIKNNNDTIFMIPNIQALNEVIVSNRPSKREFIKPLKNNLSKLLFPTHEVLVLVYPNDKYINALFEKIHFQFNNRYSWLVKNDKSYKDAYAFIRVNIYRTNKKLPGESIYSSPPIKISGYSQDELLLELPEDTYLTFSKEGLYFGIELIGYFNNGKIIESDSGGFIRPALTTKESKHFTAKTYLRFSFSKGKEGMESVNSLFDRGGMVKKGVNRNLAIGFTLIPQETKQ